MKIDLKEKFKKNKGITIVALMITVVILIILASIAFVAGRNTVETAKVTAFTNELKTMQQKVNELNQKYSSGDTTVLSMGYPLQNSSEEQTALTATTNAVTSGYRYYAQDTLKNELGLDNFTQEFLVNVQTRSVVSLHGINIEGETYYTLSQLPNGLYNVDYSGEVLSQTSFDLSFTENGSNLELNITNIQYSGNVNKGTIYYGQEENGQINWRVAINNTTDTSYTIIVQNEGTWYVKVEDAAGNISNIRSVLVSRTE